MARGDLPLQTPTVDPDSFFAVNLLYIWASDLSKDLAYVEGLRKSANTPLASNTVLALDDKLNVLLKANRKYRIQGKLFFSANFKLRFVGPSTPTLVSLAYQKIDTAGNTHVFDTAYSVADIALPNAGQLAFDVLVHNGTTEGFFGISWAQNASNVTPTNLYAGSWLQHSLID